MLCLERGGLGYARNHGARRAGDGLLVFMDDDLAFDPEVWRHILSTERGQFKMYDNGCPRVAYSTRIMVVWSEDFWAIGGFDECIRYYGEDVEFLIRALKHGLKLGVIPAELVHHVDHEPRWRGDWRKVFALRSDQAHVLLKYPRRYVYIVQGGWLWYARKIVKRPKSFFPLFPALIYQMFRQILK